ncbi:CGNR zinc finger domain-containing protein [Streptomyces sp. SGAir0957]
MAVSFTEIAPDALVDLVNGWGALPRQGDGRADAPHRAVSSLTRRLSLPTRVNSALTVRTLADAADRLHAVFAAQNGEACARELTRLLTNTGVRPAMEAGASGSLGAAWSVDSAKQVLPAAAAITLRQFLADRGFDRIGVCTGGHCADVYLDQSPAGRRRFCSVTCQNRARVAAFRRRRADAVG